MAEKEKPLTKRAERLLGRLREGKVLCARVDCTEEGQRFGCMAYWLEPDGKKIGPASARELIQKRMVKPNNDGLFDSFDQTWAVRESA